MYLYVGKKVKNTEARAWVKVGILRGFEIIFFEPSELEYRFSHTFQSFMIEVIRLP